MPQPFKFNAASVAALPFAQGDARPEYRDAELPGLRLRVGKSTKTYVLVYFDKTRGSQQKVKLGNTLELTPDAARRRAMGILAKGPDSRVEDRVRVMKGQDLMNHLLDEFLEKHVRPNLSENSAWDYERQIDNFIRPRLGKRPYRQITRTDLRELFEERSKKAPSAANKMKTVLASVFTFALKRDLIEYNPVHGIEDNETKPRKVLLSDQEIRTFMTHLNEVEPLKRHYFWLCLLLAQRRGELAQMQWSQLSKRKGQLTWTIPEEVTKNGRSHSVPIPPLAQLHIDRMRERTGETDFVFYSWELRHNREPGPVGADHLTHWLTDYRRRIMPKSIFTIHDFRRTAATGMAAEVKDQAPVKRVLNHLFGGVTNVYDLYQYDDVKLNALTLWEKHVRRVVPKAIIDLSLVD